MIHIENIVKRFGELEVLHGITFNVERGEIVSIVGASGAGKSTLLQIIGTLMTPDKGNVTIDGKAIAGMSDGELSEFRNRHVGFVFQSHHLLEEFSSEENVMMPMLIAGVKRSEAQERAKQLLELVQMSHRLAHRPSTLSGGEQQRVAIARAIVNHPALLLADEPSGNLDTKNRDEIHSLFFRLRDELGQTTVIVTHDDGLASMADRKITMRDGLIL